MSHPLKILARFKLHIEAMDETLSQERRALETRDVEVLTDCSNEKLRLCQALAAPEFSESLATSIQELEDDERTECELQHTNLLAQLTQIRDSNLVNGKILNRSQNSVREILHLLSGRSLDGLYGESGQPNSDTEAGGESIARV
ncbi:MAG: hypothetical protein GKR90_06095 [Pseudomonadales bacterium]|nr:hypothetical protein [Pseudomonadales bacterium]